MSAAVAAKRLRQRILAPEEIMVSKSGAGQRCRGRPPKKVKSCPPMDIGKLVSQKANTPTNQAQVFNTLRLKNLNYFHILYQIILLPTVCII
jgi:hypothetical protein